MKFLIILLFCQIVLPELAVDILISKTIFFFVRCTSFRYNLVLTLVYVAFLISFYSLKIRFLNVIFAKQRFKKCSKLFWKTGFVVFSLDFEWDKLPIITFAAILPVSVATNDMQGQAMTFKTSHVMANLYRTFGTQRWACHFVPVAE